MAEMFVVIAAAAAVVVVVVVIVVAVVVDATVWEIALDALSARAKC